MTGNVFVEPDYIFRYQYTVGNAMQELPYQSAGKLKGRLVLLGESGVVAPDLRPVR